MISASAFDTYVQENAHSFQLFYYIDMVNVEGGILKFTNDPNPLAGYVVTSISMSDVVYRTNLRDGLYSVGQINVEIDNTKQPTANANEEERNTSSFSTGEMETKLCTVQLGFPGMDDLGADEFDIIELAVAIQKATGVTISEEDEANVQTVGDFIKLVEA